MFGGGIPVGEMADQGIEAWPLLGGIDTGNRIGIGGIGTQPIDRLGRKGHQFARAQFRGSLAKGTFGIGSNGQCG